MGARDRDTIDRLNTLRITPTKTFIRKPVSRRRGRKPITRRRRARPRPSTRTRAPSCYPRCQRRNDPVVELEHTWLRVMAPSSITTENRSECSGELPMYPCKRRTARPENQFLRVARAQLSATVKPTEKKFELSQFSKNPSSDDIKTQVRLVQGNELQPIFTDKGCRWSFGAPVRQRSVTFNNNRYRN